MPSDNYFGRRAIGMGAPASGLAVAVSLLSQGVAIQDVSILLGHSSVQNTERYYAPWDRHRRERLMRIAQEAGRSDPVLGGIGQ